jgi:hypothetical protein
MKTKHLLLLPLAAILLSFTYLIGSKHAHISWGPTLKEPAGSTISKILGADESGIYAVRYKRKGMMGFASTFILESFDAKMNQRASKEAVLKFEGKELEYEFSIFSNGRLFVFGSFYNANLGKSFLFYQEMDKKSLTNKGSLVKVSEVSSKSKYRQGKFRKNVSRDKSKIAIVDESAYMKGESEEFYITVYDAAMNKLWTKSVKLPYNAELFSVNQVYVDNDGNFYLSGIVYNEVAKSKRKGKPNYNYSIIAFREQGNATKEYKAQLKDKFITDLSFGVLESEGSIVCGGFFSEKGTFSIKGTFFMSIDGVTEAIKKQGIKEFDKDFLEEFMSESKASKGKELFEYDLKELVLKDDGGAVLIAEQFFINVVTYTTTGSDGRMTTRTTTYYNYNDMIVVNVNPDNTIAWAVKVPKRQVTANDGGYYSSYSSMVKDNKVHLIFNDNPKNLTVKDPKRIANFNGKGSAITLATITSDGDYEKVLFASNAAEQIVARPKVCEQVSDERMILYGEIKKTFKLATVSFN